MRPKKSILPEENIKEYELLTYLNEKEIIKAFTKFCKLEPDIDAGSHNPGLTLPKVEELPELQVNPFKDRLIYLFTDPLSRCMRFEDYLDMMSVFSERAPMSLKAEYAFKIYDFDGDDLLSRSDLKEILARFQVSEFSDLEQSDWEEILTCAMKDCDIDEDGYISYMEFYHLLQRLVDFPSTFLIRL